ncbi:hypothetical protein ELQ88_28565 [Pseudomonas sp. MPC6]|nr:hypothetical protein ELQ88_28565 [Pseudomonas sp. MPC6]
MVCCPFVGASLLAMVVNDDAPGLMPRGVFRFFASKLAPTRSKTEHPELIATIETTLHLPHLRPILHCAGAP